MEQAVELNEDDDQPPKTGLELPLIWTPPALALHDCPEPEPLLPAISAAGREDRLVRPLYESTCQR